MCVAVAFLHVFIPKKDAKSTALNKEYKGLVKKRDASFEILEKASLDLSNNQISTSEYLLAFSEFKVLKKTAKSKHNELKKARKEAKILHFKNTNVFVYQLSILLILLLLAIILNYFSRFLEYVELTKVFKFASFVFMCVSFCYIVWVFYPQSDTPNSYYYSFMILSSIVLSSTADSLLEWLHFKTSLIAIYKRKIDVYKSNFRNVFDFIGKAKKYVAREHVTEYRNGYLDQIDKFETPE